MPVTNDGRLRAECLSTDPLMMAVSQLNVSVVPAPTMAVSQLNYCRRLTSDGRFTAKCLSTDPLMMAVLQLKNVSVVPAPATAGLQLNDCPTRIHTCARAIKKTYLRFLSQSNRVLIYMKPTIFMAITRIAQTRRLWPLKDSCFHSFI